MLRSHALRRFSGPLLVALSLSICLWTTAATAAEPSAPTSESAPASPTATTSQSDVRWWFYLSAFGLAVMIPVGVMLYRRIERREDVSPQPGSVPLEPQQSAEPMMAETSGGEQSVSGAEKAFFSSEELSAGESTAQLALNQSTQVADHMCPECGEKFPSTVVLCPHDSTPLQKIERESASRGSSDEGVLDRKRCPGCSRRFEPGPAYCYHDGMRLRQDTVDEAEDAPVFKVCETCGWEGQTDDRICPKDGQELTSVAPGEEQRMTPPIPVLVCSECGEFAAPGNTHCPEDGTVLTPVRNAHATRLPAFGHGPRRKICQECGQKFSGAARYCCRDGTKLVSMN